MYNASNTVYVGGKPVMDYVLAVTTSFYKPNTKDVTLKARGRAIATAVNVAEIARHRFVDDLNVGKITIGTEELHRDGETRNVSTIEITLTQR